ncbi:MAG: hypothetical protein IKI39_00595 [Oscillospiraceae bacterium]|nr:hypothetical protein [Oscillospiraceae bacterium]
MLLTAFTIFIMFGAVLGVRLYQGQVRFDEAERLFEAGAYAEARELYLRLGDEACADLCTERLNDARYQEAEQLLEAGDYSAAEAIFAELDPYKDSAELLKKCAFLRAGDFAAGGQPEKAREVYITLGNYPGVKEAQEALIPALYDRALELAQEGDLKQATTLWWVCNDYKDSAKLLKRADKALMQQADKKRVKLNDLSRRFGNPFYLETYQTNEAYIVFPEKADADTRFFLYFPGGRDTELYTEFLYYYLANPAPNTLAVFLRRNDLPDMEGCCRKGLRILDEAAADCGVFPAKVLAAGSSLGAYPALQSPRIAKREYCIDIECVLSLDAGKGWSEEALVPTTAQCKELAELQTQLYLFQRIWVDTSYEPIARMVNAGCWVMLAGCLHDEHEQISYDALGMGIIDWALTDRSKPCPGEIYSFRRLMK